MKFRFKTEEYKKVLDSVPVSSSLPVIEAQYCRVLSQQKTADSALELLQAATSGRVKTPWLILSSLLEYPVEALNQTPIEEKNLKAAAWQMFVDYIPQLRRIRKRDPEEFARILTANPHLASVIKTIKRLIESGYFKDEFTALPKRAKKGQVSQQKLKKIFKAAAKS